MGNEQRSLLLVLFERFVGAHRRCGAFVWELKVLMMASALR